MKTESIVMYVARLALTLLLITGIREIFWKPKKKAPG